MDLIHYPDDPRPSAWRTPILALGNFDGLHRGHMTIIERVRRTAVERGVTPVVLTFDPHPTRVTRPDRAPRLIMTTAQKLEVLAASGMSGAAIVRFTPEMSQWSPETFVSRVLVEWLSVSEVWVGANFLFGHNRTGDVAVLRELGARFGFAAGKVDSVLHGDALVSSSSIRRLIHDGRVGEAAALIGRPFVIDGTVVAGDGRGRQIGVPTANLRTDNELLPARGVYATRLTVRGVSRTAVTNIGVRPTVGDGLAETIETHMLDVEADLYGDDVRLAFVRRLRDEQTFESLEALRAQIAADVAAARAVFCGPPVCDA